MEDFYNVECPHCNIAILIKKSELNCKIFFCGIDKITFQQYNPHTRKEEGEKLKNDDKIYGCGKQFTFNGEKIEKCENL